MFLEGLEKCSKIKATFEVKDNAVPVFKQKEHAEHKEKVFERFKDFLFKVSDTESEFFITSIKYLGQIIDMNEQRLDNERCFALKNLPLPTNMSTLQPFLELINYYNIHEPNIHKWRASLNNLFKKVVYWNLSNEW